MTTEATTHTTDQLIESLTEGIARLATTESWRGWLDVQRTFHRYSFNNCLLIARQCPEASQVAGFHAWRQLGRWVRKGEKSIRILAPVTRRVGDESTDGDTEPRRALVGFRAVGVFDISQTDGEPIATVPCERLTGDAAKELWVGLAIVAADSGYSVAVTNELPGERNGDCRFDTKAIRVRASNAPAQRVKTLAHELAHVLLHEDGTTLRQVAELEAESAAYIVCKGLDLDSSAYSFGYVAQWAGGSEEAIAGIRASGERISRAARHILDASAVASAEEAA